MPRLHQRSLTQGCQPLLSHHLRQQRRDPIPQLLDQLPHRGHRDRLNRRNPRQRPTKRKIRLPQRRRNLIRRNRQRTQNLQFGVLNLRPGLLSQIPQRRHRPRHRRHRRIPRQQRRKHPRHRIRRLTGQRRGHLRLRLLQPRHHIRQLLARTIPIASKSKHRRLITLRPLLTRQIRNPLQLRRNLNTHPTPPHPTEAFPPRAPPSPRRPSRHQQTGATHHTKPAQLSTRGQPHQRPRRPHSCRMRTPRDAIGHPVRSHPPPTSTPLIGPTGHRARRNPPVHKNSTCGPGTENRSRGPATPPDDTTKPTAPIVLIPLLFAPRSRATAASITAHHPHR